MTASTSARTASCYCGPKCFCVPNHLAKSQNGYGSTIRSLFTLTPSTSPSNVDPCMSQRKQTRLVDSPSHLAINDDIAPLTVVLDLDETLVYAREGRVCLRSHAQEFLQKLVSLGCEVIAWTAGERGHVLKVLADLDPQHLISQCIYRGDSWLPDATNYWKDLRLLKRDMSSTVIIDNSPECIRRNTQNAIVVEDYRNGMGCPAPLVDYTLYSLGMLLSEMACSHKTVPEFLHCSKSVRRRPHRTVFGEQLQLFGVSPDPPSFNELPPIDRFRSISNASDGG